jgi:hypothetical protein
MSPGVNWRDTQRPPPTDGCCLARAHTRLAAPCPAGVRVPILAYGSSQQGPVVVVLRDRPLFNRSPVRSERRRIDPDPPR